MGNMLQRVALDTVVEPKGLNGQPARKLSSVPVGQPATLKPVPTVAPKSFPSGLFWTSLVAAVLAYGYSMSGTDWMVPYEGSGYWVGVAGGTGLLLQLVYSFVKRMRSARKLASAPLWFNLHIFMGIAAPILILYHSNFSLGAKNSNVALACMAAVVISGLIGRYIYRHIHSGMSAALVSVNSLLENATSLLTVVETDVGTSGGMIAKHMSAFAERQLKPHRSMASQIVSAATTPLKIAAARIRFRRLIRITVAENARRLNWQVNEANEHKAITANHVDEFLSNIVAASQFGLWERLFSAWHYFHLPLYLLLIVSGVTHIVSVHWY